MDTIKTKLKVGDQVIVISGKAKGQQGKITEIDREKGRAIVEGVNLIKKTVKKSKDNQTGGIISREAPLAMGKIMYFDNASGKGTRLGYRIDADGKKVRYAKRSGQVIA